MLIPLHIVSLSFLLLLLYPEKLEIGFLAFFSFKAWLFVAGVLVENFAQMCSVLKPVKLYAAF